MDNVQSIGHKQLRRLSTNKATKFLLETVPTLALQCRMHIRLCIAEREGSGGVVEGRSWYVAGMHTQFPHCLHGFHSAHLRLLGGFQKGICIIYNTRSLGALRAPTSRMRPFGPSLGPSGLLDNVLHALRALRPCDPRNIAMI